MKEVTFLNKNAERWKETEKVLFNKKKESPDYYAELFIKITDDLAFAKTYFPGTPTEKYLNTLAAKIHSRIYKNKKGSPGRLKNFWVYEFPFELYFIKKYILYSFIVLVVSFLLGWISAEHDNEYSRIILGDYYVNQTVENIENGDPMGIYKSEDETEMFVRIAFNNVKVMFAVFLSGIFVSLGTYVYIFRHGVMLAGFFHIFSDYDVFRESLLTVWIHGTIEIFTLIVSGGVGIMLGNSILFPGTFKRKTSFIRAARRGTKIVLGLVPFIIFAALLEGFVTRHTEWNDFLRGGIIFMSGLLIIWYFFVYPAKIYKKTNELTENLKI